MPISPEKRKLYPANWRDLRAQVQERAGDKCETCGVKNHAVGYRDDKGRFWEVDSPCEMGLEPVKPLQIVCTTAHLYDNDHGTQDISRLKFWCQRCHLNYDRPKHMANAAATRRAKKFAGQVELFA